MNKRNITAALSIVGFLAGLVFFCTYQEWLVIYWHKPSHHTQITSTIEKKNITLWREKDNSWIKESFHILWSENQKETERSPFAIRHRQGYGAISEASADSGPQRGSSENFKLLTTTWLAWLHDEQVLTKKIGVESILFSPSGYEMYVSFDYNPFEKNWSIYQKESFIHALLKNYKEQGCTASYLYVLVHHKPLQDMHLDFSEPWQLSKNV